MYRIKPYSYIQANRLGVQIFPSTNTKHKIEVYDKNGVFICYIGSPAYSDYATYLETHGQEYANKRREAYRKRHFKTAQKKGSASFYAYNILW